MNPNNRKEFALEQHRKWNGKIRIEAKAPIQGPEDLAVAYTPGVAEPCLHIAENKEEARYYTIKGNTIAVVSDGSAVLGLGNIGPEAALPVMEGKCVLFQQFGGVNAFPLCLDTQDTEEIIQTVQRLAPNFGGINLEDISSPRCVEIENRLKEALDIPVFHDDQHGTAIVTLAALINALKIVDKRPEDIKVVISGAGAAGYSIAKLLLSYGVQHLLVSDSKGALTRAHGDDNPVKEELRKITNPKQEEGSLKEIIKKADVFIGVSKGNLLEGADIQKMAKDPIVFAMANPVPEIDYHIAKANGAKVVATGRSDFPNQINNVLAFPGIFKGALRAQAEEITEDMKLAAAFAIAKMLGEEELHEEKVIIGAFEGDVAEVVAQAVEAKAPKK